MLKKIGFCLNILLLVYFCTNDLSAQDRYWIFFKDKSGVKFNPYQYFDKKAIERRNKLGISLYDSTDFPINDTYIKMVEKISGPIHAGLRWFNTISATLSPEQFNLIKQFPFVRRIETIKGKGYLAANSYDTILNPEEMKLLETQINRMQGELFHSNGFTGKGIRIAVFDAGFPGVDKLPVFNHLRENSQIKATWDFARKKPDVYIANPHGTMVLSCITGIVNGKRMGMATDAEFLLARTEIERESQIEEEYWLQAVEWADKNGADIINSSLAYTYERYYTFEMNGHTSLVSKAANLAADKGILVINAMGNDGNTDWKVLATPADADSVLSVGAINPSTDFHAGFSSFGPTSEFKMKPNVVAPGKVLVCGKLELEKVQGTSFAAPLVTGFAACAWQSMPYLTNMQLFEKIEQSGHLYPYFDYAHGYGVPQASFFINQGSLSQKEQTFEFKIIEDTLFIEVDPKYIDKNYFKTNNYLYYHIENDKGYLEYYWLIDVFKKRAATINLKDYPDGRVLRANYKGFTHEIQLK
jgi:serine protease AprX